MLVKNIEENEVVVKEVPIQLELITHSSKEEKMVKEEMKIMKEEIKRIKEALGFLFPPETESNILIERPKNILAPLVDKLEEKSYKRDRQYEEKFFVLEKRMEEKDAEIKVLTEKIEKIKEEWKMVEKKQTLR